MVKMGGGADVRSIYELGMKSMVMRREAQRDEWKWNGLEMDNNLEMNCDNGKMEEGEGGR